MDICLKRVTPPQEDPQAGRSRGIPEEAKCYYKRVENFKKNFKFIK